MSAVLVARAKEVRDDGSIVEVVYVFSWLAKLLEDFQRDVENWS